MAWGEGVCGDAHFGVDEEGEEGEGEEEGCQC